VVARAGRSERLRATRSPGGSFSGLKAMEAVGNYVGEVPKTIACCCGTSVQGGNAFVLELELLCAFGSNLFRATP
jgi:hypothetical protein